MGGEPTERKLQKIVAALLGEFLEALDGIEVGLVCVAIAESLPGGKARAFG
jgi:hypothetical protein